MVKNTYANIKIGKIKAVKGKRHDYLAMTLDFMTTGVLQVNMTTYIKKMIDKFPEVLQGKTKCPWSETLFKVIEKSTRLEEEKEKKNHTFVVKGMFLCKLARQDLLPSIIFLATRVKEPNQKD